MIGIALTWAGVVLGVGILLLMAVGPAVADLDGRFAERRRAAPTRTARAREASAPARAVGHGPAAGVTAAPALAASTAVA